MAMYLLYCLLLLPLVVNAQTPLRGHFVLLPNPAQPQKGDHISLALGLPPALADAAGRPQFYLVIQSMSDCGMVADIYTGHYTHQGKKLTLYPTLHGWPGGAQTQGRGGSEPYTGAPFRATSSKGNTQLTLRMGQGSIQLIDEAQAAKQ